MTSPAQKTASAIVFYALGRWQTALIVLFCMAGIAATIVLLAANAVIIGAWIVLAVLGVASMVAVSFRDAESIDEALTVPINPGELRTPELRVAVQRAREYREGMRRAIEGLRSPELRASLATITRPTDDPAYLIFTLAKRIEAYHGDRIIQDDLTRLRSEKRTGALSPAESEQLDGLDRLAGLIKEAETTVESTLAQLGTSYAEVQTIRAAGDVQGGRAQIAVAELQRRTGELSSIRAALDEVYAERM